MRHSAKLFGLLAALFLVTGMMSCAKDDAAPGDLSLDERNPAWFAPPTTNVQLIGLSPENELVNLVSGPPVSETSRIPITGLRVEEFILSIDTRPSTREVYGISNMSQLYVIDIDSGAVTAIGGGLQPAIQGKLVAFDFSPVDDKIRLMTDEGQNLRISPVTGAVEGVDIPLNTNNAVFNSIAYTNSFGGSRPVMYGIDYRTGGLYFMTTPQNGVVTYLGSTNFSFGSEGGFDISANNVAWALSTVAGSGTFTPTDDLRVENYRLLNVNLRNGRTQSFGITRPMIGLTAR